MPKGKKTCSNCGTETGPRAFNCPKCNHEFSIKSRPRPILPAIPALESASQSLQNTPNQNPKVQNDPRVVPFKKSAGLIYITTPGKSNKNEKFCPVEPINDSDEEIKKWINKLFDLRFIEGAATAAYTPEAIKYFCNHFWPMYIRIENPDGDNQVIKNEVYEKAVRLVDEICKEDYSYATY